MSEDREFVAFIQSINQRVLEENDTLFTEFEHLMMHTQAVIQRKHLVSLAVGELAKQIYELRRENARLREQVATYQRTLKKEGTNAPVSPTGM